MNITYIAATGNDKIISTGPAVLERIIVGIDETAGTVNVSDDPAKGDADVKISLGANDTLLGVYDIGGTFRKGITADLGGGQTKVTFIWRPVSV